MQLVYCADAPPLSGSLGAWHTPTPSAHSHGYQHSWGQTVPTQQGLRKAKPQGLEQLAFLSRVSNTLHNNTVKPHNNKIYAISATLTMKSNLSHKLHYNSASQKGSLHSLYFFSMTTNKAIWKVPVISVIMHNPHWGPICTRNLTKQRICQQCFLSNAENNIEISFIYLSSKDWYVEAFGMVWSRQRKECFVLYNINPLCTEFANTK